MVEVIIRDPDKSRIIRPWYPPHAMAPGTINPPGTSTVGHVYVGVNGADSRKIPAETPTQVTEAERATLLEAGYQVEVGG